MNTSQLNLNMVTNRTEEKKTEYYPDEEIIEQKQHQFITPPNMEANMEQVDEVVFNPRKKGINVENYTNMCINYT